MKQNEENVYREFADDLILRDYLARDRTRLANERTMLAYFRTFVGFLASGAGFITVFDNLFSIIAGSIMMSIAPVFLFLGIRSFIRMRRKLSLLDKNQGKGSHAATTEFTDISQKKEGYDF